MDNLRETIQDPLAPKNHIFKAFTLGLRQVLAP